MRLDTAPEYMNITRLSYEFRIKCSECDIWQDFPSTSIHSGDMALRRRMQYWRCRMCGHENLTTYELGLNTIRDD